MASVGTHLRCVMSNDKSLGKWVGSIVESSTARLLRAVGLADDPQQPHSTASHPSRPPVVLEPSPIANQSPVSFTPWTKVDVLEIYHDLSQKIPAELVARVIEEAQLWEVHKYVCYGWRPEHPLPRDEELSVVCSRFIHNMSVPILYSDEIHGSLQNPLRKVIVQTRSKDQGWSSYPADHGTHNNSWTWFEIALERRAGENEEWTEVVRRKLWSNIHAGRDLAVHVIELQSGDEIVNKATKGDRICIWACASFPGWRNVIDKVELWTFNAVH